MSNLIFDYDGTLHDCSVIYCPAFRKAYDTLAERGYVEERNWSEEEITPWLGYSAKEMWDSFVPDLPQTEKDRCSRLIGNEMLSLVQRGEAKLYADVPELLDILKAQGHTLLFLSNCKTAYLNAHREQFKLDRWFSRYYCTEQYGWIPKTDIFPEIQKDISGKYIVIGDRFHDIEVAERFGLFSIGCTYGYGTAEEMSKATVTADSPLKIFSLLPSEEMVLHKS